MRQKLFNKFFLATSIIVLVCLTVMMMILTFTYNHYFAVEKNETMQKTCDQISEYIVHTKAFENDDKSVYFLLSSFSDASDIDIFCTDVQGNISVCGCDAFEADGSCDHSGSRLDIGRILTDDGSKNTKLNTLDFYKEPHYVSYSEIVVSDETVGYVICATSIDTIKELMTQVSELYIFSAIIPILIMFIALYIMTYRMTRPLKMMSIAARAMAKGDFSKRIPVTDDDEIGELAVAFNQMTNSLAQLEGMRKSFVADVSHELKTPMTTIGGFIDGIIDGTIEPEKQGYYLKIVSDEVKRLSRLLQTMLSISKLESGEFVLKSEKFDFRELLIGVVISQEQRIEQLKLDIRGLETLANVTVNADKDLIHQVVYNLVDNAIKFNVEGGYIDFSVRVDAKKMSFCITNTGRGIPPTELPYVFERFYKVDKSRSANKNSTGLGLYIVKNILKNHGGTIKVSSKENEFTTFEVQLPLSK